MSEIRKQWQAFKKKYPTFEKSRNFKADAGPAMDDLHKKSLDVIQMVEKLEPLIASMDGRRKKLDAALAQYGEVVKAVAKANPGAPAGKRGFQAMLADFSAFEAAIKDESEAFEGALRRSAKRAQPYARDEDEW